MSVKVVARALRAHFIIDSALTTILLEEFRDDIDQLNLQELYQGATSNQITVEEVNQSSIVTDLQQYLDHLKSQLARKSRKAKLSIQSLEYILLKISLELKHVHDTNI